MYAMQIEKDQPNRPLVWVETPDPVVSPDEVLLQIHATALNRADLLQRAGNYPPPPGASDILGLEAAGVIAQTGARVEKWHVGDPVCALLPGGGYAELVAVPQEMLMPIPTGWSMPQAGGLPEVFLTAYVNLFMEAGLQAGETVLIHGGASGVGTAAIQLAREAGCQIIATAGSAEKVKTCLELGANLAINYRETDFAEVIAAQYGGVDVILDMVGAAYFARNLELLNLRGRLVIIGLLSGPVSEVNFGILMRKRARVIGSVLRSRSLVEKVAITRRFQTQFGAALNDGRIQPVIDTIFPVAKANEAHERMGANQNTGKIILQVQG